MVTPFPSISYFVVDMFFKTNGRICFLEKTKLVTILEIFTTPYCDKVVVLMIKFIIPLQRILYKNASSSIYVAREVGTPFSISRLVRQGYPLAPFRYLLIVEAFHVYFNNHALRIKICSGE